MYPATDLNPLAAAAARTYALGHTLAAEVAPHTASTPRARRLSEVKTMRAIVQSRYGSPEALELREVAKPTPKEGEVLIRARASSINPGDWHLVTGKPYLLRMMGYGVTTPKHSIPGMDVAGEVEALGPGVTDFRVGDEVFGELKNGAFAEYVCASQDEILRKPKTLSFEEAAAVPCAGFAALQSLRDAGGLEAGGRVLINGASGGVGTFAVQIAKAMGAHVTAVCSGRNVERVQSLGADEVIDYETDDFARRRDSFDLFVDWVGNRSIAECRRVLTPTGTYVSGAAQGGEVIGPMPRLLGLVVTSWFVGQQMKPFMAERPKDDLVALRQMIEAGDVKPVLDRSYPLTEVPRALMRQGEGHARGKTVIAI